MPVRIVFECSGCGEKADGIRPMESRFISVTGRSYGFGSRQWVDSPDDLLPIGWVAADTVTGCTYCRACWDSIIAEPVRVQEVTDA